MVPMPSVNEKKQKPPHLKSTPMKAWALVCGKCGRFLLSTGDHVQWWLEGTSPSGYPVVRCPQHITDWSMRQAGRRRTMATYRWRRLAKEHDQRVLLQQSLYEPFFDPNDLE